MLQQQEKSRIAKHPDEAVRAYHDRRACLATDPGMSTFDFAGAMKNPGRTFGSPEVLESSAELSAEQKHAVLLQWKDQLEQLMVATAENMPGPESASGANADCLRRVVDALTRIEPHQR
jgi:hypothetical protein